MKFQCQVDIDLPRSKVIELFDNPDNMQFWQDGFISFTHKDGVHGEPGSTAIVKYKMGRGEMELLETVISRNLPEEFHGSYEGDFGKNYMYNYFNELDSKQTRWIAEIEYIEMKGFMMNVMKTLFPKTFQKQTQKWLNQFKTWAESKAVAT